VAKFHPGDEVKTSATSGVDNYAKAASSTQPAIKEENRTNNMPNIVSSAPAKITNGNANDFLCEICSSKFESNIKLQAHLLLKHEHQNQQIGVSFKKYLKTFTV